MLSMNQEREIANDLKLLLVTNCVLNHWTFEEILKDYKVSEQERFQLLARLDQLKVIELQPFN